MILGTSRQVVRGRQLRPDNTSTTVPDHALDARRIARQVFHGAGHPTPPFAYEGDLLIVEPFRFTPPHLMTRFVDQLRAYYDEVSPLMFRLKQDATAFVAQARYGPQWTKRMHDARVIVGAPTSGPGVPLIPGGRELLCLRLMDEIPGSAWSRYRRIIDASVDGDIPAGHAIVDDGTTATLMTVDEVVALLTGDWARGHRAVTVVGADWGQ